MSLVQAPSLKCFFSPGPEKQPTVKNLYPKVETVPARKPAATAPKGVSIISLDVPTTTPPASAAFWMWTYKDKKGQGIFSDHHAHTHSSPTHSSGLCCF